MANRLHAADQSSSTRLISMAIGCCAPAQIFDITDCGIHAGDILVSKRSYFDLHRCLVWDEIFAERRQRLERSRFAPYKSHVWREDFVSRADEIVAIKFL